MLEVTNQAFLSAIFQDQAPLVHVSDFYEPPNDIPQHLRPICWVGGAFSEYQMSPGSNQYFCISRFRRDSTMPHRSLRRKNLFEACYCVVLDDVREKLDEQQAAKLPAPSWILETSPGSEQWGYILEEPETRRERIDNLHDGLIKSDLAPDSKDPGMRGVTRFVRLPEGWNRKTKYLVPENGHQGVKCQMLEWHPDLSLIHI
mgnify:CR=1 FL=1